MKHRAFLIYGVMLAIAWLCVGTFRACTAPPRFDTLAGTRVVYLISPDDDVLRGALPTFEVTNDSLLLAHGGRLLQFKRTQPHGPGLRGALQTTVMAPEFAGVTSFTIDAAGAVLAVRERDLLQAMGDGSLSNVAELPFAGFLLSPSIEASDVLLSSGSVLLRAGQSRDPAKRAAEGSDADQAAAHVDVVATLSEPIVAVADAIDGTYLAGRSSIYQVVGQRTRLVMTLPLVAQASLGNFHREPLRSLAVSEDGRMLFFSTEETVYALSGVMAVRLTDGLGGILRYRDGVLFVLDPWRGWLVGIENVPQVLGL